MKKKISEQKRSFPLRFSWKIVLLCVSALLLCAAAIAITVVRLVKNGGVKTFDDVLRYPFLIAISLVLAVLVIALLVKSEYTVDSTRLTTRFGLIKSSTDLGKITALVSDKQTNKLTVKMSEEYAVISVDPSWSEEFVRAILEGNPSIDYSFTLTENKPPEEEKKN